MMAREKIESEIEPEKLEETYMEPLIVDDEEPEKDIEEPIRPIRLRKPVIDESDPSTAKRQEIGVEPLDSGRFTRRYRIPGHSADFTGRIG